MHNPIPICSPIEWHQNSRLRDQSAAECKNCRPVPIGYTGLLGTDNSLECADLSVCAILTTDNNIYAIMAAPRVNLYFNVTNLAVSNSDY